MLNQYNARSTFFVTCVLVILLAASGGHYTAAAVEPALQSTVQLAPGLVYDVYEISTSRGMSRAHVVTADLNEPHIKADLLYTGKVAEAKPLSITANDNDAVVAVNADFFSISSSQPGVAATGAPVGPAVIGGVPLTAAVPAAQRFGPGMPWGVTVEDVLGLGDDGRLRLDQLILAGEIVTPHGVYELAGLNQYALPENGIGLFNHHWGSASRRRAVCGSDLRRDDPCTDSAYEVTVQDGKVVATAESPGHGSLDENTFVLLAREEGADLLRQLALGDDVHVSFGLQPQGGGPLQFAVGGHRIVADGAPGYALNRATAAIRTGAGIAHDGTTLILVANDRNAAGLTYFELAELLMALGATEAINFDGGGSTTMVVRLPDASRGTVVNLAASDAERPVPNGIALYVNP